MQTTKKTGKEVTAELDSDYDSEYEHIESTGKDFAGQFFSFGQSQITFFRCRNPSSYGSHHGSR